jgi:hypothetical protein
MQKDYRKKHSAMKLLKKTLPFVLAGPLLCLAWLSPEAMAQTAQWTFMVYLDGDNNLELSALNDFLEMATVGSNANVKILALFDRIAGHDSTYDDWTDTRRGIVNFNDTPDTTWGTSLGELNMGHPQNLIDFVEWGMQNYPASRYAVVLWDHGSGWQKEDQDSLLFKSVCDDNTDGDRLFMRELRQALETIEENEQEPDLLGFDACLMGMVEVAYEIRNQSSVMLASEKWIPLAGWPYHTILADLAATPTMNSNQLGSTIVTRYYQSYGNSEIQSAIDLSSLDMLTSKIDVLAQTLRYNWNSDIGACVQAACGLMTALDGAVIAEAHGTSWPGSHGLAIYFPETSGEFNSDYNGTTILFPLDTQWEDFLSDFHASMSGSWVANARDQSQEYDANGGGAGGWWHVDLYDFCEKLIENASGLIWADFAYVGVESGTYDRPYNTLTEAVTAASGGQTICIKPSSSSETLDITKELTLRACGGMAIVGE